MIDTNQFKYCFITVPHSGTRYIRSCFKDIGYVFHSYASRVVPKPVANVYWGHFSLGHEKQALEALTTVENSFVPLRDPIATFGTWMQEGGDVKNLLKAYQAQYFVHTKTYGLLQYFPMEHTSIEDIGKYINLPLADNKKHFSMGDYPIKQAIKARDLDKVNELSKGSWEIFRVGVQPYLGPYMAHNYDLWWNK